MTGWGEWLVLAAVVTVFASFRKLPALGSAFAQSLKSFRQGLKGQSLPPREVEELHPPEK